MADYREACDNRIYLLTSKIIYLFITNVWFLITISPLILYFFISGENISIPVLTFLGILIGPALSTMFSVMEKVMNNKQDTATKDYFHFYKINFAQSVFVAAIINVVLMICYVDIGYFSSANMEVVSYLFIALAIFMGVLSLYIYPILGRINAKTNDLFKISIKLILKKFYITVTNISVIIIGVAIVNFTSISLIAVLFGGSAICYFILRMERDMLSEAEVTLQEKYSR